MKLISILAAVAVCSLVLTFGAPVGHAGSAPPLRAGVTSKGLTLTLELPRRTYRLGSKTTVTMTVRNVSRRPIALAPNGIDACAHTRAPRAVVMSNKGAPLFPRERGWCATPSRVASTPPLILKPGERVTDHETIVLLGPRVRAFVWLPNRNRFDRWEPLPGIGTPVLTIKFQPTG